MMFKKAFTLAEVLITLGLLGIVAAITVPTVMQNSNGVKYRSGLKNGLASLNQAVLMSSTKYNLDFSNARQACDEEYTSGDLNVDEGRSFCAIFSRTLSAASFSNNYSDKKASGYNYTLHSFETIDSADSNPADSPYSIYTLANGMFLAFSKLDRTTAPCKLRKNQTLNAAWIEAHPQCLGFIDVNGVNLPNREVGCTDGRETNYDIESPCKVDTKAVTDIFPVVFYNSSVEPASNAAMYVLTTSK